ncbi:GMC family oxidoreductase [Sulfurovum sp. XTW-4]|uniref:GMC family oxidoreductase n=1 Tax=Sulfurovum xiamenensis TaxID=3019066 RepID=A0ABT7QUH6_9BACT|nr:GMC family oxidoreductase [Sulfurovum xiamenensis]MDM5264397.1 GMC family oxidoreductase [Sulfurovum xiamenensis]
MLYNLNMFSHDPFKNKRFDICIIGAGIAGITLALSLDTKFNVLLLEGGGMDYSEESQELYRGESTGFDSSYPIKHRGGRWLGGSSNLWAGRCHPYTDSDFKKREYIQYSGWPISKKDLDPYHEKTREILDLPPKTQNVFYKGWTDVVEKPNEYFSPLDFMYSFPPTNFKIKYEDTLRKSKNIFCYVNANLTDMALNEELSDVSAIQVRNYKEGVFEAYADTFVLAAGGIENPRLLLNFNKQLSKGIGNDNDLVGRFFSDHPHSHIAYFLLEDDAADAFLNKEKPETMQYATSVLTPTEKFQDKEKMENYILRVTPNTFVFSKSVHFRHKLKSIICATDITRNIVEKYTSCEDYEGYFLLLQEQEPNPKSRVTLGEERDRFGLKRPIVNWTFVENDMQTAKKAIIPFAKSFAASGMGRVKIDDWVLQKNIQFDTKHTSGGFHHMGTTRMAHSPKEGVVDKNTKVFGIGNLYIAGSSVFPTGGCANPTYTIVQMTLRLADHLNV